MPTAEKQSQHFDIVVVGGGYAGLALVRGLVQVFDGDIRIAVIDRVDLISKPVVDGRAFAIWAGAKAVLEGLGVWTAIAGEAQCVSSIEISDSALLDGIRPTRLTYDARTSEGLPAAHIVPSGALQTSLYRSVESAPCVTWFAPADVGSLVLGEHAAEIELVDGTKICAALCVAADGKASRLRDAAGIATIGWGYPQTGIVATVKFGTPHAGVAIQHFLPGGPFAILPLDGDRACITWSAEKNDAERIVALDDDDFLAELDQRIGGRFGDIALDGPRQSWPLDFRLPRQLIARRFVLIGDAAHGVHPIAGQGANLALRDVAALVEILTDAAHIGLDFGSGTHLERYERWRRFDSAMSAGIYDGLNRLFSIDSLVLRAGRGAALGVIDLLPSVKQAIITEASGLNGDLPKLVRGVPR